MQAFKLPYPSPNNAFLKLKFKNEIVSVPKFLFAQYSKKFKTKDNFEKDEYTVTSNVSNINEFINACQGKPYNITEENLVDFYLLSLEFEVDSILQDASNFLDSHPECIAKIIIQLNQNKNNENLLVELAKRIDEVDLSAFLSIDQELIKKLFSCDQLSKKNESKFLDFAQAISTRDCELSKFIISTIDFTKLTLEGALNLISLDPRIIPETFQSNNVFSLIKILCDQCTSQKSEIDQLKEDYLQLANQIKDIKNELDESTQTNNRYITELSNSLNLFQCIENNQNDDFLLNNAIQSAIVSPFQGGVISRLSRSSGRLENQIEIITPNNMINEDYPPINLFKTIEQFISYTYYLKVSNKDDNWITFHFLNKTIKLYGVSIRTNDLGDTIAHPKSFEILGSNDNVKYDAISRFYDDGTLNGKGKEKFFCIDFNKVDRYSYIRYKQYETHHNYRDSSLIIALSAIEFFGILD